MPARFPHKLLCTNDNMNCYSDDGSRGPATQNMNSAPLKILLVEDSPSDAALLKDYWGVSADGNFEGRNILFVPPSMPVALLLASMQASRMQLALVIDLNVCVGCHACVTSCKEWNTSGAAGYMSDDNPYARDPTGTFFNRVQTFEVGEFPNTQTVHFPKSCLHCEDPPCVPVCPTNSMFPLEEVPAEQVHFAEINAAHFN